MAHGAPPPRGTGVERRTPRRRQRHLRPSRPGLVLGDELTITVEPFSNLEQWVRDAVHDEGEVAAMALGADTVEVSIEAIDE